MEKVKWYRPTSALLVKFVPTEDEPPEDFYWVGEFTVSEGTFRVWKERFLAVHEPERYWAIRIDEDDNT